MARRNVRGPRQCTSRSNGEWTTEIGRRHGWWTGPGFAIGLALVIAQPILAQADFTVEGVVVEVGGTVAIQSATVELEGYGVTLTSADGTFRFDDVRAGAYSLRVTALGYATASQVFVVSGDLSVTVSLEVAPFELDSLLVNVRTIDFEGRVRDPQRDTHLPGVDIVNSQRPPVQTNARGYFTIDEVLVGVPLGIRVDAFGYLPLDTAVTPRDDVREILELTPDPLIEGMISTEIARIEDRAGGLLESLMRPMTRAGLLRWSGATLADVLRWEYPFRGDRVACVVVDEKQLDGWAVDDVLQSIGAEDVERMEFLFGGGMLRVYTREFMRSMMGGGIELGQPSTVATDQRVYCR